MEPGNVPPMTPHKVGDNLTVTQAGERTLFVIRRHPIGIIGIYLTAGALLILAALIAFGGLPHLDSEGSNTFAELGVIGFFGILAVTLIFTLISTKVYWGNRWIVTTDSITQIDQNSLFSRESSQLSLENLEDVTADQTGILSTIIGYGLLKVETAGERSKFSFPYCPNPNFYAQEIIKAREAFAEAHGGE